MRGIGGNITAEIQICTSIKNEIGEGVQSWETVQSLLGYLDSTGGDSAYTTYNAKIQESTHVFVADYVPLNAKITAENSRFIVNGKIYDTKYFDNPMELKTGSQWEIFLKYVGG